MFIAIDIGNTDTVVAVYKEKIIHTLRLKNANFDNEKSIKIKLKHFFKSKNIISIKASGISSVVPALTKHYSSAIKNIFNKKPFIVSAKLKLWFNINYHNPNKLGADRICNVVAGFEKYKQPLIIIDFGTATTYDVVSSNGDFLGGVIASGIETSAKSLFNYTAQLKKIKIKLPKKIIAHDTKTAMQSGVIYSAIYAAQSIVKEIQYELNLIGIKDSLVIATGGFANLVAKNSNFIDYVAPFLVTDGIFIIYKKLSS